MSMIKLLLALLCLLSLSGCVVEKVTDRIGAPTPENNEQQRSSQGMYHGEFATLGTAQTEIIVGSIKEGNTETVNTVLSHPNDFTPPVLYALADYLMMRNETFAATFWHYTAQLRARSDANKSLDPTVREGLTKLNGFYGRKIRAYAGSHVPELKLIMKRVIEYDEIAERNYDPRWVAVLGKDALSSDHIAFSLQTEFAEIDKKTRHGFYQGFLNVLRKSE